MSHAGERPIVMIAVVFDIEIPMIRLSEYLDIRVQEIRIPDNQVLNRPDNLKS